ncbi:MAG: hypothetical protein GY913_09220 [Proteobacteria bacterium]|nr:hypothetical protein [Pseudomonadota bacterium]MCP4917092.1 hypothetical protein [Pseudomonadota bacterium]
MLLFGAYCWRRNQRGFGDGHLPEDTLHETLVDAEGAPRHESARAPDALRLFLNGYTVVLTGLLVGVLWVAYDHSHDPAEEFERIVDAHVLNSFLDDLAETELEAREELPLTVPTGVFVQSVTFQSSGPAQHGHRQQRQGRRRRHPRVRDLLPPRGPGPARQRRDGQHL